MKTGRKNKHHETATGTIVGLCHHRHDQTAASIIAWRLGMGLEAERFMVYKEAKHVPPDAYQFVAMGGW